MKNTFKILSLVLLSMSLLISCEKEDIVKNEEIEQQEQVTSQITDPPLLSAPDLSGITQGEADAIIKELLGSLKYGNGDYAHNTHGRIMYYAALKWGINNDRASTMYYAASVPDEWDQGWSNSYWQQWSHAWLRSSNGNWIWGDADDDFDANVETAGYDSYLGSSAFDEYQAGNQTEGDKYLGYASHYLADACGVLHCSDPIWNMLTKTDDRMNHYRYEGWVCNNMSSGHNFAQVLWNDGTNYYAINSKSDLKQAIYNVTYWSSYWTGDGDELWDSYADGGFLEGEGDYAANSDVVLKTKNQLLRAKRYTMGMIKYALDANNAW